MLFKLSRKAQSVAEYGILLAVVIGAIAAMQIYVKGSYNAKIKGLNDYYISSDGGYSQLKTLTLNDGKGGYLTSLKHYEPDYLQSVNDYERAQTEDTTLDATGLLQRNIGGNAPATADKTTRLKGTSYQKYLAP